MCTFGQRIKAIRLSRGLSQRALADLVDISERGVQNYELGSRKPTYDIIIKFSEGLNVSADYLLGLSNNPKRND